MRQRQGDPREDGEKRLSGAVAGLPCAEILGFWPANRALARVGVSRDVSVAFSFRRPGLSTWARPRRAEKARILCQNSVSWPETEDFCARAYHADAKEGGGVEAGQPRQASARIRPIRYRVGRAVPSPSQNLRRGLRHPLDATPSQAILGEACDKGVSTAVTALQHASFARRPPSSKKAPSRSERGEAENPLGAKPASHPLRPPAFGAASQRARTSAAIRRRPPKTARSSACTAQRGSAQTADHAQDGPHSSATCR